ncbi:adenosylcobinamide-GDP ribazoletransferase [Nocardioides sp.]|uniref:adenosylcobinamide-GDP ribazoletransferase n=1 Tax=Nocardioides sp. TaxID=35761 RepID=UPI003D0E7B7C
MTALWLALGTLTILPVPAPTGLDRTVAGRAMTLAPVVGVLLAVAPVALVAADGPPVLLAVLAVAALAVSSRALHLDGLADTADGLGSALPADRALAIMRKSDIGPFGVVTIVLVLLVQVTAISAVDSPWTVGAAIVVSRGVLPLLCLPAFPPSRPDGLGAVVAGSVRWWQATTAVLVTGAICVVTSAPACLLGLIVGLVFAWHCRRRLGGVTGDVYGACVELTLAAALVAPALLG